MNLRWTNWTLALWLSTLLSACGAPAGDAATSAATPARAVAPQTYGITITDVFQGGGVGMVTGVTVSGGVQLGCPTSCYTRLTSGTVLTLTATPASSSSAFLGWGGACSGTAPTCTVTMSGDVAVTATFAAVGPTYPVAVTRAGSGTGTVRSIPTGIECGAACTDTWARDTVVTLIPEASGDSVFTGWSGACTGSSLCTIPLTEAAAVTATFAGGADLSLLVTLAGDGDGRVFGDGLGTCPDSGCAAILPAGTVVTLEASPMFTSTFTGWGGACSGTEPTCTVVAGPEVHVSATFTRTTPLYTLTVAKAGTGAGLVTSDYEDIRCGARCSYKFGSGMLVTLTAAPVPGTGSTFAGWGGACRGAAATCTVTMSEARTVTATFNASVPQYPLAVSRGGSGAGDVTSDDGGIDCGTVCSQGYVKGAAVTLSAVAAYESTFTGWSGACTGASPTCVVTMGAAAQSVKATFDTTRQTYALDVTTNAGDAGVVYTSSYAIQCGPTCSARVEAGTVVTLTASAAAGTAFTGWGGACSGTAPTCALVMSRDRQVTATFQTTPPPATCKVAYKVNGQWPGGFVATLTIQNTGATAWNGWTVRWTYPDAGQRITAAWNASAAQRGQEVTLRSVRSSAVVPAGAAVPGVVIAGTWKKANPAPAAFSVNGIPCKN